MKRTLLARICVALGALGAACASPGPSPLSAPTIDPSAARTPTANTSEAGGLETSGAPAPLPRALGTPGVWEKVTSPNMDAKLFANPNFGIGSIVTDPARPTDLYVGGYGSIWKSTDYGLNWRKLDSRPNPPSLPLGHVLAVAGTTPATLWMASASGEKHVYKSTDAGLTFTLTGSIPEQPDAAELYSIVVDPQAPAHLLSGLHEQDRLVESTDGGETWHFVSGRGWPSGGNSWFVYFVDTGVAASSRKTWFAIGQNKGCAVLTKDGGKTWAKPAGLDCLTHPHGSSSFYQHGQTLFVAGVDASNSGGVYRSTDLGEHWTRVAEGSGGVVWGSSKNVYAMWGWACSGCGLGEGGPQYQTAPQPGDTWSKGTLPKELNWGPNSVATTSDGQRTIFVGSMWATGLWRFIEP